MSECRELIGRLLDALGNEQITKEDKEMHISREITPETHKSIDILSAYCATHECDVDCKFYNESNNKCLFQSIPPKLWPNHIEVVEAYRVSIRPLNTEPSDNFSGFLDE